MIWSLSQLMSWSSAAAVHRDFPVLSYVTLNPKMILADGRTLAGLMVNYGLGAILKKGRKA